MNLQAIKRWAEQIDIMAVVPKKRDHAANYKNMIIERVGIIEGYTVKINNYMENIQEFKEQLAKINIIPAEEREPEPEPVIVKAKESPLLPKEEDGNKAHIGLTAYIVLPSLLISYDRLDSYTCLYVEAGVLYHLDVKLIVLCPVFYFP